VIAWLLVLSAGAIELDQARQAAVEQAAEVEVARAQADAATARARSAAGLNLPQLSGFADLTVGSGYTPFGFERPIPWQAGVGVRGDWTIVDPARWAAATAARRTARGRQALLRWTRAQARQEATTAYAQVQAAAASVTRLEAATEDARRGARAVQELVEAGLRPPADAARARADAQDLAARLAQARGDEAAACARLEGIMGQTVDGRCQVSPVDWSTVEVGDGPEPHPALDALAEAESAAKAQEHGAVWEQLPGLSATGTAAQYVVPERNGPGWSATLSLDVPLTLPTTGHGDIAAARADRALAQAELEQQARDLAIARVQAEVRLDAARRTLQARQAGQQAAAEAWRRVDARFQQGLEDLTTWLDARRARIDAEINLAAAEAEVGVAVAAVEGARGVGASGF